MKRVVKANIEPDYGYLVESFYEDNFRGLADSEEVEDLDTAIDVAHDLICRGRGSVSITNMQTGEWQGFTYDEYFDIDEDGFPGDFAESPFDRTLLACNNINSATSITASAWKSPSGRKYGKQTRRFPGSYLFTRKELKQITAKEWLDVVRLHAQDGVDFLTIHCGINRETAEKFKRNKRKMNIVSRGGSIIYAWMQMTGNENPFFEYYDELLDICREYDVTISLGDACRPGCIDDATDAAQVEELMTLGELTLRAWERDVQVMIEGPGHMPMNQIAANMEIQKTLCHGAPFYVLGPLVTDIAPGYDHITSAIGGAMAAWHGAAFLCYVTPAEHLRLPDLDDVKEGIMASKIAAHAADIAKGLPHATDADNAMADARRVLDWEKQFKIAIDPEKAKAYRESAAPEKEDSCSMCGNFCSVRNMNKILEGGEVKIFGE